MTGFWFYFLLYIIYSMIGWFIEVITAIIEQKKFINRGFLIGPYCPIYGFGSLLMIILLNKYYEDPIVLFILSAVIAGILEYLTSLVMEKVFRARWWDYSKNKFNINGRICLETLVLFGAGGCFVVHMFNPFLLSVLEVVNPLSLKIISMILFCIFLIDNILSFNIILNFKKTAKSIKKDSTEEITKMVRSVLSNKSFLSNRLINAFPDFQAILKKYDQKKNR